MIKGTNVIEMTDLLAHAKEVLGLDWDRTYTMLYQQDHLSEAGSGQMYLDEIDLYSWSEQTKHIIRSFMIANGLEQFTMREG